MSSASLLRGGVLGISVSSKGLGLLEISKGISNPLLGILIPLVGVLVSLVRGLVSLVGELVSLVGGLVLSSSSYSIISYLVVTLGIRYRAS